MTVVTLLLMLAVLIALAHERSKAPLWALSMAVALIGVALVLERLGVLR